MRKLPQSSYREMTAAQMTVLLSKFALLSVLNGQHKEI